MNARTMTILAVVLAAVLIAAFVGVFGWAAPEWLHSSTVPLASPARTPLFRGGPVDLVEDGQRGLGVFERDRHEIVITALWMSGLNGWDVIRAVRRIAPETRVVLMTGWSVDIDAQQVSENGVDGVLRKPFDVRQVRGVLAQILRRRTGGST